ncbi:MAG: lipopolysaccharide biosynthesis glycosyltransferase [Vicingaceae bacterium]|jgi:lipopolysaccharide biosynthesis glycosyltransferase
MLAIVTVTDEKFYLGTQVMFYSFLKHNSNFEGDLVVIHHQLPQSIQDKLSKNFTIKFIQVSEKLRLKLEDLTAQRSNLKNKLNRFYSLEIFRFYEYSKVLFLDSDTLIRKSLDELLKIDAPFSAVADLGHYNGWQRNKVTFSFVLKEKDEAEVFTNTFNSGVMLLQIDKFPENTYLELLKLLNFNNFKKINSGHTDQYVLNQHFVDKINWLNVGWNYILRAESQIKKATGVESSEAAILHYIRFPKPWQFTKRIKETLKMKKGKQLFLEWDFAFFESKIKLLRFK